MNVEVISDKLLRIAQQSNSFPSNVTIYSWMDLVESELQPDILVLDLDFTNHTNEKGTVPTFFSNIQELRAIFKNFQDSVVPLLESGRVIIAIVDQRTGLNDLSKIDSLSWLDRLQSVQLVQRNGPKGLEATSDLKPVQNYLDCVDKYEFGIRVQDGVVTDPQILAQNPLTREPVAIAVHEYLDPNGIPREMSGELVLLPQPTNLDNGFFNFIQSLSEVGQCFLNSENTEEPSSQKGQLRLHPAIFDEELIARCSQQFNQGKYQDAVQNAFIALEERIRKKGDYPYELTGVDLATEAFKPGEGPLAFGEITAEEQGIMQQYRSAFMAFRNPSSHRFLDGLDEVQAYHLLSYANMLIRMLEENTEREGTGLHRDSD